KVGAHHFLLAQEFGPCQHHVGGGDALGPSTAEFHADDVGQAHPGSAAQHHAFGLQTTNTDRDHAQRIDVRRVGVGAHASVRVGQAVVAVDDGRHFFQVDLVHDAVA